VSEPQRLVRLVRAAPPPTLAPLPPLAAAALAVAAAVLVDVFPLHFFVPARLVPVADTLLGHGALAGALWALGARAAGGGGGGVGGGGAPGAPGAPWWPPAPGAPLAAAAVALAAAALDADHFVAARSLRLADALALPRRPFGHAAGFGAAAVAAAALAARALGPARGVPAWAPAGVALAWLSHVARDALRRGFALAPLPFDTPPLPYGVYALLVAAAPAAVAAALGVGGRARAADQPLMDV